ncbi:MAG: hypothetical protein GY838_13265 [bacterium]|nr:hypothetical protein [bacterium]
MPERERLPAERRAINARLTIVDGSQDYDYDLTAGYYDDGRIGELFVRTRDPAAAVYDAMAMAISIGLQHGATFDSFRKHLEFQAGGPAGKACDQGRWVSTVSSPLDMIAKWVGKHQKIGATDEK